MLGGAINKQMRKEEKENENVAKKERLGGERMDSAARVPTRCSDR